MYKQLSIFLSYWPNPGCPSVSPTSATSSLKIKSVAKKWPPLHLQITHAQRDTDRGVCQILSKPCCSVDLLEPCCSIVGTSLQRCWSLTLALLELFSVKNKKGVQTLLEQSKITGLDCSYPCSLLAKSSWYVYHPSETKNYHSVHWQYNATSKNKCCSVILL